ncbi:unnamed protein product, partial [Symbiodinium necroappetens]
DTLDTSCRVPSFMRMRGHADLEARLRSHYILGGNEHRSGSMALHVKAIHPDLMLHWDNAMAHSLTLREGQDEEMPPTSALGKRAEHRLAEGPAKFSKPAGKGQGQGSHYPPESEPSHGSGQSSDQWQDRPANPKNWTKEQTRQRQDEMWRQWESNTSWYQTQDIKKLRQELEQLQEHVRLLARMSLRHEDELSQGRTERDFVLTFEPPTPGTNDNSANMLVILFRMAVVWKEKKEEGKVDSSLRLVLFLGLIKQYIKQITTSLEQPEDREQLAMMKFLRQTNEGRSMEWPYLRWNQERQLLEEAPMAALSHTDLMTALATLESSISAPRTLLRFHSTRRLVESHQSPVTFLVSISLLCYRALSLLCFNASSQLLKLGIRPAKMERQPLAKVLAEHFPPPEMAMGRGKQGKGQGRDKEPRMSPSRQGRRTQPAPKSPAIRAEPTVPEAAEATEKEGAETTKS